MKRAKLFTYISANLLGVLCVVVAGQFEMDALKGLLVDLLFRTHW